MNNSMLPTWPHISGAEPGFRVESRLTRVRDWGLYSLAKSHQTLHHWKLKLQLLPKD